MKNVIRVTILTALAVTAGLSTAMAQDQPPPDCYPCLVSPIVTDQAPAVGAPLSSSPLLLTASLHNESVASTFVDQPPPDCYPCFASPVFIDQPPPDCYPCFVAPVLVDQPPPDCYPCFTN
jgi:hypothetical protein